MGWFSDFFSGKRAEETPQQTSSPASLGNGTRQDGSKYYQDVVHDTATGFRVQRGEEGEKRIKYRTKDGSYVTKKLGDD